ncbi:MAG: ankyrin repeat domain-containing protein [Alphaproteobacteria bacterium]|jgi:ankyrin repeat protein
MSGRNPYKPSLGDKFWRMAWLPGRKGRELEEDFHYAVTVGKMWRAELLLSEKKVDITSGDHFAVRWAANGGHVDMLKLLFRHGGVDVNAKDGEALIRAATRGHHAAAALLLEHGADVARQDYKALRIAAAQNDTAMLAHLLAAAKDAQSVVRELLTAAEQQDPPAEKSCLHLYRAYLAPRASGPGPQGKNDQGPQGKNAAPPHPPQR